MLLLAIITTRCQAQTYGTLRYWGKEYKLDRKFISVLNENWSNFINGDALTAGHYDYNDYIDIYNQIVNNLTNPSFTIIVTESNQLQWLNPIGVIPGTDGEKGRNKRSVRRAKMVLYKVVLPALNQFMQYKEYKLD